MAAKRKRKIFRDSQTEEERLHNIKEAVYTSKSRLAGYGCLDFERGKRERSWRIRCQPVWILGYQPD